MDAKTELIELVKANPDICDALLDFIKWMRENPPQAPLNSRQSQ